MDCSYSFVVLSLCSILGAYYCAVLIVVNAAYASADVLQDRVIHVNEFNGTDNATCLGGIRQSESSVNSSCQSLNYIASKVGSGSRNITIILESPVHLRSKITFENCEVLSIKGKKKSETLIDCKKACGGILFKNVNLLLISNTVIHQCCGRIAVYHAVVLLHECSNVTIQNVIIKNTTSGSAVVLVNPSETVSIIDTGFLGNGGKHTVSKNMSFAAGLHMQFSEHTSTNVTIQNCRFRYNKTPNYNSTAPGTPTEWNGQSLGGGVGLVLLNNSTGLYIRINGCIFDGNEASWGAGFCIYLQPYTFNNTIIISNTKFEYNRATIGGGGAQVRLSQVQEGQRNFILFHKAFFMKNLARFGCGTSISALYSSSATKPGEILQFINCTWTKNNGPLGPAIDISPDRSQQSRSAQGYLPVPLFKDSLVTYNEVRYRHDRKPNHKFFVTQGVFSVTSFFVYFQGYQIFKENRFSALYVTSGRISFDVNSNVIFHNNQATKGGAIALYGLSTMTVHDHSEFHFINNSATRVGGGIWYISSDQREYFEGRTCFLEYGGGEENIAKRNITFEFQDNKAPLGGMSIYSETFLACYYAYYEKYTIALNLTKIFDRVGKFTFDTPSCGVWPLATAARNVFFEGKIPLEVAAGDKAMLPLAMHDEFNHTMHTEYGLRIEDNTMIHLDNYFTVNNETRIYGEANETATLILSTPQPLYNMDYHLELILLPCPPGLYFDKESKGCKCSADNESQTYPAITKCINFRAFIKYNYWVGYYPSERFHPDNLYTAFYPSQSNKHNGLQEMPSNSSNLSTFVCGITKEGVLCGRCKLGHSAFYHSGDTLCGENKNCKLGPFFYLLSELLPMVVFFSVVMISGVNFSYGTLNGFVFFSQVLDTFTSNSKIKHTSTPFTVLQSGHQLIYGIFNFNYFSIFPFCLWKGARVMDVIVFKYVTFTFAFLLIILIIILMNCSSKLCTRICSRRHSSVTHGISTFLILCYGQCTRVGFFILIKTYLRGKPGTDPVPVTYYGGLPYFGTEHLPYAILAIIFTFVLVGLPPIGLIMYPLLLHLLELCGLSEHQLVERMSRLLCLNRLVPLFDSLQSSYKDKMRFFAGIYFLYRVAAYLGYMYGDSVPQMYLAVLMLGVHSILQPYKSRKHNVLDALLFLNIATINSLTIMIRFSFINGDTEHPMSLEIIQLFFIYLPIAAILLLFSVKVSRKIHSKVKAIRHGRKHTDSPQNTVTRKQVTHTSIDVCKPLLLDSSVRNYM